VRDVPYYRQMVQSGQASEHLRSWEDFSHIPVTDRSTLQLRQKEFCRLSGPAHDFRMTGGSTGVPVRLGVWRSEAKFHRVAKLILWQRAGYRPSDKLFLIWGHSHLLGTGLRGRMNHVIRKLKDSLLGYKRVDAYSLSPRRCETIARQLLRFRPLGLIGYASALDYFVRATEPFHEAFGKLGLHFVMPAAEMLPRPDSRQLLERVFRCGSIEEFAGVEFGQVAMREQNSGFQVFHDLNYVEALPGAQPGLARVVLTALYDRYVPLIRYAPGDEISGPQSLSNGHVAAFTRVEGRINDSVHLPDGTAIHTVSMLHCIHQEPSVLNIQLVLEDAGPRLRLVVGVGYDAQCEQRIRHRLADVSPGLSRIPIDQVPDVATTVAGKRRWIHDARTTSAA